jgi:hypothetical protein
MVTAQRYDVKVTSNMFKTMMKKQLGNVALLHVYTSMPSLA